MSRDEIKQILQEVKNSASSDDQSKFETLEEYMLELETKVEEMREVIEFRQVTQHELATDIAYIMRTQLTAMIGFAGLMKEVAKRKGENTAYLEKILAGGRELLKACDLVERLIV